jgi:hypothetical protein
MLIDGGFPEHIHLIILSFLKPRNALILRPLIHIPLMKRLIILLIGYFTREQITMSEIRFRWVLFYDEGLRHLFWSYLGEGCLGLVLDVEDY